MATDPGMISAKSGNWITPKARFSFVNVFKPGKAMDGNEPKFGVTLLFDKDADFSLAKKMCQDALLEKFGAEKLQNEAFKKKLRTPFRDQGEKEFDGYVAGCIFITATSKQKPSVVDANGADILEERDVFSGCYGRASLRAFAYDQKGNVGVAFGLQNVQKLADGEPFGGRSRPSDDFEPVAAASGGAAASSVFD